MLVAYWLRVDWMISVCVGCVGLGGLLCMYCMLIAG